MRPHSKGDAASPHLMAVEDPTPRGSKPTASYPASSSFDAPPICSVPSICSTVWTPEPPGPPGLMNSGPRESPSAARFFHCDLDGFTVWVVVVHWDGHHGAGEFALLLGPVHATGIAAGIPRHFLVIERLQPLRHPTTMTMLMTMTVAVIVSGALWKIIGRQG